MSKLGPSWSSDKPVLYEHEINPHSGGNTEKNNLGFTASSPAGSEKMLTATKPTPYETSRHYTFTRVAFIAPPVKIHFLLCRDMHRLCAGYMHKLCQTQRKTQQMHHEKDRRTVHIHHCLFNSRNLSNRFVISWKGKMFVLNIGQDSPWDEFTNF